MAQLEITAPVPALDDMGRPRNFGWARAPHFVYDPGLITAPRRLVTEADRYVLISPDNMITLEILDSGFEGCAGMSAVSFREKKRDTRMFTVPYPLGSFALPESSAAGSVRVAGRRYCLTFAAMEGGARIIKVDIPRSRHHQSLRGEVALLPPPGAQSLVTLMPWRRQGWLDRDDAFRCTQRSPWYVVEGVIQRGSQELIYRRGNSWGIFDWTRAVRPRKDICFWAAGAGRCNGRQVGISVGYDAADAEMGTDNGFFLDGKLHKLDQVTFHIAPSDWQQPWRFTSNDNRLEMTFFPLQARMEKHQMFLSSLRRRQAFGMFAGRVVLDTGEEFSFTNITGFAERRATRF